MSGRRVSGDNVFVWLFGFTSAAERREADLFLASLLGRGARRSRRRATLRPWPDPGRGAGEAGEAGECPVYERGEEHASKQEPGILPSPVVTLKADTLLVADFGVDWRHVKPATKVHPALRDWLAAARADPDATLEVLGYSDCVAPPKHNDFLRRGRARGVAALVGPRATSVKPAPVGSFVATNLTRTGRAMNRGATIRVVTPAPKWVPPAFVRPDSVIEMVEMLDDAEGLLVDPAMLDLRMRRRLHGPGKAPTAWKPDVAGALKRIDAVLDFVRPLVEPRNIASHGRDDLKATLMNLFPTTDWLKTAVKSHDEVRRLRDAVGAGTDTAAVADLTVKAKSALAFRAKEPLKVLADEGLSFELELGVESEAGAELPPEPAQPAPRRDHARQARAEGAGLAARAQGRRAGGGAQPTRRPPGDRRRDRLGGDAQHHARRPAGSGTGQDAHVRQPVVRRGSLPAQGRRAPPAG